MNYCCERNLDLARCSVHDVEFLAYCCRTFYSTSLSHPIKNGVQNILHISNPTNHRTPTSIQSAIVNLENWRQLGNMFRTEMTSERKQVHPRGGPTEQWLRYHKRAIGNFKRKREGQQEIWSSGGSTVGREEKKEPKEHTQDLLRSLILTSVDSPTRK